MTREIKVEIKWTFYSEIQKTFHSSKLYRLKMICSCMAVCNESRLEIYEECEGRKKKRATSRKLKILKRIWMCSSIKPTRPYRKIIRGNAIYWFDSLLWTLNSKKSLKKSFIPKKKFYSKKKRRRLRIFVITNWNNTFCIHECFALPFFFF